MTGADEEYNQMVQEYWLEQSLEMEDHGDE